MSRLEWIPAFLLLAALIAPQSGFAADAHHELSNTTPLFLGGEALLGATLALSGRLAVGEPSETCQWCESNSFDRAVRGVIVVESLSKEIGYGSHAVSVGLVPIVGLWGIMQPAFAGGHDAHAYENAAMVFNAFLVTTAVAEVAKGAFDRQRPGVYYGRADQTEAGDFPSERNRSFFSADTAWAFSIAASASTVAHLRGYENATAITIATGSIATVAGILRTAADMHWPTDVLTGAAVGTTVGILMPLLLHGRESTEISVVPAQQGLTLQWFSVF